MMIVNDNINEVSYKQLFQEAELFLRKEMSDDTIEIRTINAYYAHMADYFSNAGWKFVMFTDAEGVINESPLKINLDTRMIDVPNTVSTCAGVQKDQLAELLIFEVDRFFDYMDLTNTDIFVQWKNGTKEGDTRVTMVDFASKPGKILFAWPLTTDVTHAAGQVEFSVRFFRRDEADKVIYSLNTRKALLTIQPALAPDLNNLLIEPVEDGMFTNVILNSVNASVGTPIPQSPIFGVPGRDISLLTALGEDNYTVTDFNKIDNKFVANLIDNKISFCAQAYTTDSGTITYTWYHITDTRDDAGNLVIHKYSPVKTQNQDVVLNGNVIKEFVNSDKVTEVYVRLSDSRLDALRQPGARPEPNEIYYEKVGSTYPVYNSIGLNFPIAQDQVLYERYSVFTVPDTLEKPITGDYYVSAINTLEQLNTANNPVHSNHCSLPRPAEITFKKDLKKSIILDEAADASASLVVALPENIYNADIQYVWSKSTLGEEEGFTELTFTDDEGNEINSINEYIATERGWYKVKVISTLNRETEDAESTVCKITKAPEKPVLTNSSGDDRYNLSAGETQILTVTASVANQDDALYSEGFDYEWYMANNGGMEKITEKDAAIAVANGNTLTVNYVPHTSTDFYISFNCIAYNRLNGMKEPSEFLKRSIIIGFD